MPRCTRCQEDCSPYQMLGDLRIQIVNRFIRTNGGHCTSGSPEEVNYQVGDLYFKVKIKDEIVQSIWTHKLVPAPNGPWKWKPSEPRGITWNELQEMLNAQRVV